MNMIHFYNFIAKKRDPSHERSSKKTEWLTLFRKKNVFCKCSHALTFDKKFDLTGV